MANVTNPSQEAGARWGAQTLVKALAQRTAATNAQFFLPHLQPGMRLLDCGCGPGSITIGLAIAVAPGEVVGIDFAPKSIAEAQLLAANNTVTNVRFEVADAYELPFPDASFDAVFSHALLLHLREPVRALREMRRVLKAGGLIGIRNDDLHGYLTSPHDPLLLQTWPLMAQLMQHNGGNPYGAKNSRAWLNEAGFVRVEASASFEYYGTPTGTDFWSEIMISILPNNQARFEELGLADKETFEQICLAWKSWGSNPDAFYAKAWCEAIGWVE